MLSAIDLISMYVDINQEILVQRLDSSINNSFRQTTILLKKLRDNLKIISLDNGRLSAIGAGSSSVRNSLWYYYNKDSFIEGAGTGSGDQSMINERVMPKISKDLKSMTAVEEIEKLTNEFKRVIDKGSKPRCGCFCCFDRMFGTITQNQLLLNKNFDSKHFWVRGHRGAKLDCMFFPCITTDDPLIA